MAQDKPARRLPLRELMSDAEKRTRSLADHMRNTFLARTADLHDLSRPIRKKSHYPTLHALQNSLQKVLSTGEETGRLIDQLMQELEEIRDHARRERLNRG